MKLNAKKKVVSFLLVTAMLLSIFAPRASAGEIFDIISGTYQGTQNTLNFAPPIKGDLYFGGNFACLYGWWSHVGMAYETTAQAYYYYAYDDGNYNQSAMGNGWTGLTVEATPTTSTNDCINRDCHRFWFYDWASHCFVDEDLSLSECYAAANKADTYSGSYDWNSSYTSNSTWQCSKLVSRAYYDATGVVLGIQSASIRPDDVYYDGSVTQVSFSSAVSEQPNLSKSAKERLKVYEEKGIDPSSITFVSGINKKGIGKYFKRQLENKALDREDILNEYKITDDQLNQLIRDSSASML